MASSLRRLVERLSRGIVLVRRLPPEFASTALHVSPDSALRFWRWHWGPEEQRLLSWVRELVAPGDVVWDVGANVGVFTFAAAARAGSAGSVTAIEPDPFLAGLLRRSAQGAPRGVASVHVEEAAACDRAGAAVLCVAARGRASNHLFGAGQTTAGGVRQLREVPGTTLDVLLEKGIPPRIVKIDVEGAEAAVLQGAQGLLARQRPVVLCEVSQASRETVTRQLRAAGYGLFDAERAVEDRQPLETAAWNTLAVPEGRT